MVQRPQRTEVPKDQTWDLEGLYPTTAAWEDELGTVDRLTAAVVAHRGRLGEGPAELLACLRAAEALQQAGGRLSWFASNRLSEDQADPQRQTLNDRAIAMQARAAEAMAFFEPEILALPEGTVEAYLAARPDLAIYKQKLTELLTRKEHLLGEEAEAVLAAMLELGQAPFEIFQSTSNADMRFDPVRDAEGQEVPLSLSALGRLLQSPDRAVRQNAYESALRAYDAHKRTLTATFAASVKRDCITARLRRYPSALAAALEEVHLPQSLFENLVQAAEAEGAPHFQRYMGLRRRTLGVDRLMPWDLQAPLDADFDSNISFTAAGEMICAALRPLGPEYGAVVQEALANRWIDWADNAGKASGAYSADCWGYHPAILLNWQGKISDAFVLAHELGHTVHTTFAHRAQPYAYADYTLFLAEIASTTNELLLSRYLLQTSGNPALRRYVLTRTLGAFTGNFFGGCMMAGLQQTAHAMVERGEPITYEAITGTYTDLLKRFYGETLAIEPEGIGSTWLRMPHHFFGFYSYQYATGISAAAAFSAEILSGGDAAVERYLAFLKAGSAAYPLEILKAAGLDMTTPAPLQRAVSVFATLVDDLEQALA
jgi:oligoendopeptidase F